MGLLASAFCAGLLQVASRRVFKATAISCVWVRSQLMRLPGFLTAFLLAGLLLSLRGCEQGSEVLTCRQRCWWKKIDALADFVCIDG